MSKETKLSLDQTNVAVGQIANKIPKQGEIWITDFNRKRERENFKIRPVLIISNDWQNQYDKYSVIAPLTSDKEELEKGIRSRL